MKWVRGAIVGRGSFGTVNLATPFCKSQVDIPPIIAVKSTLLSQSSSLKKESVILSQLQDCPQILRCFGDDTTTEDGQTLYNLLLEYVSGGTLADRLTCSGIGRLPESDVRRYARSILKGLDFVHKKGYVHCDIKPRNILVSSDSEVKIADFGLAKKCGEKMEDGKICLRGTPLYMAPESVARSEYEAPSDVWSLGCVVSEMIAGKPAWRCTKNADVSGVLFRIGFGDELPEIPRMLSDEGRDFLGKCFVRDPANRWTAEMLLNHPFIVEEMIEGHGALSALKATSSPRSMFDFPPWVSSLHSSMPSLCSDSESFNEGELDPSSLVDRVRQLATGPPPDSSSWDDDWVDVRGAEPSVSPVEEEDSLLILLDKMMRDGQRDENSNSSQIQGKEIASPSESKSVFLLPFQQCQSKASDRDGSIDHVLNSIEELACRRKRKGGNADGSQDSRMNGSESFDSSLSSLDFHCVDSPISNEYKYRNFY
ncbi:mitogen-activated protein kinase kinase kinase 20-like [Magnolia sinica]|uniref:mitogen-activated protein kinase kinase kinase 20-like n=1 Tax=Magnolia sinica TaxID=86752 RepID=UPI00265A7005|nr:mitogen-activated protein kinase kinase kinase 20-like [Magnolia sinica]